MVLRAPPVDHFAGWHYVMASPSFPSALTCARMARRRLFFFCSEDKPGANFERIRTHRRLSVPRADIIHTPTPPPPSKREDAAATADTDEQPGLTRRFRQALV